MPIPNIETGEQFGSPAEHIPPNAHADGLWPIEHHRDRNLLPPALRGGPELT